MTTCPDTEHRFCDEDQPHVIPDECWHLFASPCGPDGSSTDGMSDEVWEWYLERAYQECGLCFERRPLRGSDICYQCQLTLILERLS